MCLQLRRAMQGTYDSIRCYHLQLISKLQPGTADKPELTLALLTAAAVPSAVPRGDCCTTAGCSTAETLQSCLPGGMHLLSRCLSRRCLLRLLTCTTILQANVPRLAGVLQGGCIH